MYFKYIKPYLPFFILAPLSMMLEVYCDIRIPALAAELINLGVMNSDSSEILRIALIMMGYVIISIFGGISVSYCSAKASVNFACDLREDVFSVIQKFSFANLDSFSTGSLITRLTNDITQMQNLVQMSLRLLIRAPGLLIGSMIMAFTINAEIAVIFLFLLPILLLIISVVMSVSYKKFGSLQACVDSLNSNISEFLTNIRLIKALTREDHESERFDGINAELRETGLSAYRINILQMPLMTLAVNMAIIAVVWLGSIALGEGAMQVGDVSAFITYLSQFLMSVIMLATVCLNISRAVASSKRIKEVLITDSDIRDGANTELRVKNGEIEFKDVYFKYYINSEKYILENISLSIKAGQTAGIIGSTGCGKTSLVQLIARLYDTTKGSVLVDGRDVKDYTLKNLRESVAVVLQNNHLFSGTIKDNLLWGDRDADDKAIECVTDRAAAREFISEQPNGLDTVLGQGGVTISGGQKQRLCIARALLKQPKILILDDSTSAVDTKTEEKINHHLDTDLKSVTKLIIAQRISSVMSCDVIIVVNDGQIEAAGKHDELMIGSDTYLEIYKSQVFGKAGG